MRDRRVAVDLGAFPARPFLRAIGGHHLGKRPRSVSHSVRVPLDLPALLRSASCLRRATSTMLFEDMARAADGAPRPHAKMTYSISASARASEAAGNLTYRTEAARTLHRRFEQLPLNR